MSKSSPKLNWCIISLSKDLNWWVVETSDPVRWDTEGLSIIDPRQGAHIIDLLEPLRDHGLDTDIVRAAFFPFAVDKPMPDKRLRLVRVTDNIFESEEPLFWLGDTLDEDRSAYADFLNHITKVRVKMLNDSIDFEQRLTVDDLEDEIREDHHNAFLEGRTIHAFREITDILEYVPAGYELDDPAQEEEKPVKVEEEEIPEIEELPEAEDDGSLDEDETMKWDEEEEGKEEHDENYVPPLQPEEGDEELFASPKKGKGKQAEKPSKKADKKQVAKKPEPKKLVKASKPAAKKAPAKKPAPKAKAKPAKKAAKPAAKKPVKKPAKPAPKKASAKKPAPKKAAPKKSAPKAKAKAKPAAKKPAKKKR